MVFVPTGTSRAVIARTEPRKETGSKTCWARRDPMTQPGEGSQPSPVRDVGEEAKLASTLDRGRELGLVASAGARHAGRAYLALVADRSAECCQVLVVDDVDLLPAEGAGLETPASGQPLAATATAVPGRSRSSTLLRHSCSCLLDASVLERDVVVRSPGAHGRGREVRGVRGNVALRREATTVLAALTGAEELDGVGNDIHRLPLLAVLALPLAPFEPAVDRDRAALLEVRGAVLALRAPDRDVEVIGLLAPLAGRRVLATRVDRDAQLAHRGAAGRCAQLGVAREVSGQDDPVDVDSCHEAASSCPASISGRLMGSSVECTNGVGGDGRGLTGSCCCVRLLLRRRYFSRLCGALRAPDWGADRAVEVRIGRLRCGSGG